MNQAPVMRASDEERVRESTLNRSQHRALVFMAAIQILMIALTYLLVILQAVTSLSYGVGAAPALIVFMVVYLHFTRYSMLLAENGIKVKWVNIMKVINPILFFIGCLLCVCTLV